MDGGHSMLFFSYDYHGRIQSDIDGSQTQPESSDGVFCNPRYLWADFVSYAQRSLTLLTLVVSACLSQACSAVRVSKNSCFANQIGEVYLQDPKLHGCHPEVQENG